MIKNGETKAFSTFTAKRFAQQAAGCLGFTNTFEANPLKHNFAKI